MKKLILSFLIGLIISCSTTRQSSSLLKEDELFITRKYVGNFIDYCHSAPESLGSPHKIRIITTLDSIYVNISAYSKKCKFSPGDKIYLSRKFYSAGLFGNWIYQIENDFSVHYRISEFQCDDKLLVQTWY